MSAVVKAEGRTGTGPARDGTPAAPGAHRRTRITVLFAGLAVALVAVSLASAALGQYGIGFGDVAGSVLHRVSGPLHLGHPVHDHFAEETLWQVRMPRVAMSLLVGAGLARFNEQQTGVDPARDLGAGVDQQFARGAAGNRDAIARGAGGQPVDDLARQKIHARRGAIARVQCSRHCPAPRFYNDCIMMAGVSRFSREFPPRSREDFYRALRRSESARSNSGRTPLPLLESRGSTSRRAARCVR